MYCDLSMCMLRKADLRGANLRYADLFGAELDNANLAGADLRGALLIKTQLAGAVLTGAKLHAAMGSGWSADDVVCEYVYLGARGEERFPPDGSLQPGQIERLFGGLRRGSKKRCGAEAGKTAESPALHGSRISRALGVRR